MGAIFNVVNDSDETGSDTQHSQIECCYFWNIYRRVMHTCAINVNKPRKSNTHIVESFGDVRFIKNRTKSIWLK